MAAVILTMAAGSLAGPYVTTAVGYYRAGIGGQIPSHGVILNAGATVDFFISTLNVLYVPERKPAISACHCRPVGWLDVDASEVCPGWAIANATFRTT
ncbi:MAG: hypothetical protein WAO08_26230 [Hyphomicrobiaceae bacterium]